MQFDAFISYSHSDCGNLAPAIQKSLENIGKPWYQLKRNLTIFRDETNLSASPELWNSIVSAIDNSKNLIILASPLAKDSVWVNKEIEHWFSKERSGKLYIVKTNGKIVWDYPTNDFDWINTNSLPINLKNKFKEEPLWIDLEDYVNDKTVNAKKPGFVSSICKIIGGITSKAPREIESDELKRKRKISYFLITVLITLLLSFLLSFLFYSKNKISERTSFINNLIAEGNNFRKSDINKALLLYSYAYDLSQDSSLYKVVNQFYVENNLISDYPLIDTLNLYYSKVTETEKKRISNYSDNINIAENVSCIKDGEILKFFDNSKTELLTVNMVDRFENIRSNEWTIIEVNKFIMTSRFAFIKIGYGHFFQSFIYDKINSKIIKYFLQESGKIPDICLSNVETVFFDREERYWLLGYENGSFEMNIFNDYDSLYKLSNILQTITSNDHYTSPITSLNCYNSLIFVGYFDGHLAIYKNGETRYSDNFYGTFHFLIKRVKLFEPSNNQFESEYYHNYSIKNIIYEHISKSLILELYDKSLYKIKLNKQVSSNNLSVKNILNELKIDDLSKLEKDIFKIEN